MSSAVGNVGELLVVMAIVLIPRGESVASSTFLVGKSVGIEFSGGAYDTGKDVSTDIGAG
jgi:hypothetical protein